MGRLHQVIILVLGLGAVVPIGALSPADLTDDHKRACSDIRAIGRALDRYAAAQNMYPRAQSEDEVTPLDDLRGPVDILGDVVTHDPWGSPYWYWSDGAKYLIASAGSDCTMDAWVHELRAAPKGKAAALEDVCSRAMAFSDVLYVNGRFCGLPKDVTHAAPGAVLTDEDKQRLTVEEIQALASALRSYAVDNNAYPVLTNGLMTVDRNLQGLLEPVYIRAAPLADAWGHPYLYWSNGSSFLVMSSGKDGEDRRYAVNLGIPDRSASDALADICAGQVALPEADIIFTDDHFCQWPAATPTVKGH